MHRFLRDVRRPLRRLAAPAAARCGRRRRQRPAYRTFRNALAHNLGLPIKNFDCWSVCYGSMSGWFHARRLGVAVETVEFGWHPSRSRLTESVRHGIVAALGGHFG